MSKPKLPDIEALRENKREMFDGMRAYHLSEISHANHAITMLLGVAAAAGAVALAFLFPQQPVVHAHIILWGLAAVVAVVCSTIALTTCIKIGADHEIYANYGTEYVKTSVLLGFYDPVEIEGASTLLKLSREIGKNRGYRKTQWIIWAFAAVNSILTFLFALTFACSCG
jgi:hypothetical protein